MTATKTHTKTHPTEPELAGLLDDRFTVDERMRLETHIAGCSECLTKVVSAYESVRIFKEKNTAKKGTPMKKLNFYLIFAVLAFILSFAVPRYFIQLLVATLLLGIKWIVDSKSTKMLVMIYEAWKNGGEQEASRMLERLDPDLKRRF